ncbi:hypothetical protein E3T61_08965 [Cryobacterium lactosi]|uniref:Uncharacterized protein n=1 Tax=Cryobacterium lactosi TaxID=1259202 RepID=A0A4R9BW27_9MICO|nr:hypothetical protein [Cryobacterium lactosi]TFD91581.1 hypothetical protein E3T61_08965 [Cryobacterium lactosi]
MTGKAFQEFHQDSSFELTISDSDRTIVKQFIAACSAEAAAEMYRRTLLLDPVLELVDDERPLYPGLTGFFVLMPSEPPCFEARNG